MIARRSTVSALLVALAVPAVAAASEAAAPSAPAKVRAVRPGAPGGGAAVPASVVALRRATVATRVGATVKGVEVREGDRVRAGQLLVALSDDDVRGQLRAAEAGVAAAAAHERRIRALAAERAATPSELELATSQRAQAEAALAGARATLAYTEVRAPFDATVQARRVEPGDFVGPGQPLLDLEGEGLELVASLSDGEARGLVTGATVRFTAGAARGEAVVTSLTPGGDPVSHRRGLRARVKRVEGELRSGAFARVELPGGASPASVAWIPRTALVERGDLTGVFVASGGRAVLRWISVGEQAGDAVAVRAGLAPEDVVVDAPGALRDGQPVEVSP